jgi:3-deoxy-D-manno-octulosonic acid kinase
VSRKIARYGGEVILYDDALLSHAESALFAPAAQASRASGGRGATLFIDCAGQACVLASLLPWRTDRPAAFSDQFFWSGESTTRCFREWLLLEQLFDMGLPVPRPVAARYIRSGFIYRADLITARLPGVESLATRLVRGDVSAEVWARIGECIARFHAAGVWHADLNAHNIQIDAGGQIFLLDFDRGRIRPAARGWQQSNLARLQRSLLKISANSAGAAQFTAGAWRGLVEAYDAALAAVQR